MARSRILLDSNAYFRLARSIRPLLDTEFGGVERFALYVIEDLAAEYGRSTRLKNKFSWLQDDEYVANRKRPLSMSRADKKSVGQAFDFISNHVRSERLSPSTVDVRAIATAYVLGIRLVTDDRAMAELAVLYGVEVWTTLELMSFMVEVGHIDQALVAQIVSYWKHENDLPGNFHQEYRRLFGSAPP